MTLLIEGNPLLVAHIPMTWVPPGSVNVYGHTHNNEPPGEGPYINVCVEQTEYRPLPLDKVRVLARARLADGQPRGRTTADEIAALQTGAAA